MFVEACNEIRECIFGLNGLTQLNANEANVTNATGFMVADEVLVTAAHFCHVNNNRGEPIHQIFQAIRSPDIGQPMEDAGFIGEDPILDIALLRIVNPRNQSKVRLHVDMVPKGTDCGSLGFPLAKVTITAAGKMFNLVERFQGANISAHQSLVDENGNAFQIYETDRPIYSGSSGCPGFTVDGRVFGVCNGTMNDPAAAAVVGAAVHEGDRLAISLWTPSIAILELCEMNGIDF